MRYLYNPPSFLKIINRNFQWSTTNNKILLTFDDGPTEQATGKILSVLKSNQLKAVFFCVGNNIRKLPELTEKILGDGHTIANHTMNHKLLTRMSREESIEEIVPFNNLMMKKFNYDVKYFRPPYGKFNLKTNGLMKELNLKCVMWNLLTYDFENNLEKVKYAIDRYLTKNSIIVFHDNLKCNDIIRRIFKLHNRASLKNRTRIRGA